MRRFAILLIMLLFLVNIAGFVLATQEENAISVNTQENNSGEDTQIQNQKNNSSEETNLQNAIKSHHIELTPGQVEKIKNIKNKINVYLNASCPENCTCSGSTVKCWLNGQRTMTVVAGKSGNIIVQVKGVNASTNATLYKSEGKLYGVFKGNETKRIMTPEQVQEKIRERKQVRWESHNITLDEEGYYKVQSKKKARLFFIFPVKEKVRTQLNAETGEIVRIRNPWWGFLARDVKETLLGTSCGTVSPDSRDECCVNKGYDVWDAEAGECIFSEE